VKATWLVGLAALLGCGPEPFDAQAPTARFTLFDEDGAHRGTASLSRTPDGLVEDARLEVSESPLRQQLRVGDGARAVLFAGRAFQERTLKPREGAWRWRAREGLALEERDVPLEPDDVLGIGGGFGAGGGLGASLAGWQHAAPWLPLEGEREGRFFDVGTGRHEPLVVSARERTTLVIAGAARPATRLFAQTPSHGLTLFLDDERRLLVVQGLALGATAARDGVAPPPRRRAPLPAGVREVELRLEDESGPFTAALTFLEAAESEQPAVLLMPGSGPLDRDGNTAGFSLDVYRRLAGALSQQGYAVLRYDKPGRADAHRPAIVPALLARARAALRALADRPEANPACLTLAGHSEGGMLAPRLALEAEGVVGLLLLAAPARELLEVLEDQLVAILEAQGASEEEIAREKQYQAAHLKLLRHGKARDLVDPERGSARWLGGHVDQPPARDLARLELPTLALFGARDLQVLPDAEVEPMREALAHIDEGRVEVVEHMDHLLMPAGPLSGLGVYADPDRPLSPALLERIAAWLLAHACP
jgi:uncharacterized protein